MIKNFFITIIIVIAVLGIYKVYKNVSSTFKNAPSKETVSTDKKSEVSSNPTILNTTYITSDNWPPKFEYTEKEFTCTPTENPVNMGANTKQVLIQNRPYCITTSSEGAAGSTYTTYTYQTTEQKTNGLTTNIKTTFVLRFVQCDNYPEPKRTECKTERESFNIDKIIGELVQRLKLM
ncbi:hypothetical protein K8Q96_01800 [Candidatus Nomurabacteria bacterium]|nr:hypothetical protein [Candidatus Nomurabacteria bacterium]